MTDVADDDHGPRQLPARADLKEMVAYVKKNKDKITYANAGLGAASHLCGLLFMHGDRDRPDDGSVQGHGPAR